MVLNEHSTAFITFFNRIKNVSEGFELGRRWHTLGRWPPAHVGRAGAQWHGMQTGGQAGVSARKRLACASADGGRAAAWWVSGTAGGAAIGSQCQPSTEISACVPCSPASGLLCSVLLLSGEECWSECRTRPGDVVEKGRTWSWNAI